MAAETFVLTVDNLPRISCMSGVPVSYLLDRYYEYTKTGEFFVFTIAELKEKYDVLQHSRQP